MEGTMKPSKMTREEAIKVLLTDPDEAAALAEDVNAFTIEETAEGFPMLLAKLGL
jgi:hypothetical protein